MWVKQFCWKRGDADLIREQFGIPNCRSLLRLDKEVRREGELLSLEMRYFISSLKPDDGKPCDFQKLIRDHWWVETSLHFVKDRWWEEDRHYLELSGLGQVWMALTNAALSVLRLVQVPGKPLTQTAEKFHYSPRKALHILGFSLL